MKIAFDKRSLQTSKKFKNVHFGIGDEAVILQILRGKMYSNPIKAICQEIVSNARDAHREKGNVDRPVEVILPTEFNPSIEIKDYGPGIDEDRIENIFVKYGNTTKRDANIETGGFGLGAKTPFSYSDTFTVRTTTEDDNGKFCRTYIAVLDETNLGQLSKVSEVETTEETGTSIVIPTKEGDFSEFERSIYYVTNYWKIRPIIKNSTYYNFVDNDDEKMSGDKWSIVKKNGSTDSQIIILLDGIPYPLFNKFAESSEECTKIFNLFHWSDFVLYLQFDVGDLQITANREQLDYNSKVTQDVIEQKIAVVLKEIEKKTEEKINNSSNLLEAISTYYSENMLFNSNRLKECFNLSWNGVDIVKAKRELRALPAYEITRESKKLTYKKDGNIHIANMKSTRFVENDLDLSQNRPPISRLRTIFKDEDVCTAYVIKSEVVKKLPYWKHVGAIKLSTVEETSPPKGTNSNYTSDNDKVRILDKHRRNYGSRYHHNYDIVYTWEKHDVSFKEEVPADNVAYVLLERTTPFVLYNNKKIEVKREWLHKLAEEFDLVIYGISSRFQNKIHPSWKHLSTFIQDFITDLEAKTASYGESSLDEYEAMTSFCLSSEGREVSKLIKNNDSPFKKFFDLVNKIGDKDYKESIRKLRRFYLFRKETHLNNKQTMQALQDKCSKSYPFIYHTNSYSCKHIGVEHIAKYINLIDEGGFEDEEEKSEV